MNDILAKATPFFDKIGNNKVLLGMKDGISAIIPFTIIGSLFTIITNFPLESWTNFIAPYSGILSIPTTACMGLIAIVSCVSITYNLAKEYEVNRLSTAFIALVAFVVSQIDAEGAISTANFGAGGLFLSILIALITVAIVKFFQDHNLVIKMPAGVPPMVMESFESLIPGLVTVVLIWVITGVFGVDINGILTTLLQPLVGGLNSLPGCLFVVFLSSLLWCFGINESVISGATYPVWYALLAANTEAFTAGMPVENIVGAYGFQYFGFWLGGTGGTIGLVLLMLKSRSKVYRDLGRISAPCAAFEINEPVAFGFPICFNPVMAIPYILFPLVSTILYYLAVTVGLVGAPVVAIPWTTPPVLSGFLVTGGDWRAAVFQIAMIVLSVVIYYPFFKYSEKKMVAEEEAEAAEEAAELNLAAN